MMRSLILTIITAVSTLSAPTSLQAAQSEIDLTPFVTEAFPFETLVLETEGIDVHLVLADGSVHYELPEQMPEILDIREFTINGPEVTIHLIDKKGDRTTRRVDSIFLSYQQQLHRKRRHFDLEAAWTGIEVLKERRSVPKTAKALGGQMLSNLIFEGKSEIHLKMHSELNEDYFQELLDVGALNTTLPSQYRGAIDLDTQDMQLHASLFDKGRRLGLTWSLEGDFSGHTAGLDRVLNGMEKAQRAWAMLDPENAEQEFVKQTLSYSKVLADATAPLRHWSGVRYQLSGDLVRQLHGEEHWDIYAVANTELVSKFDSWHVGLTEDFSLCVDGEDYEWTTGVNIQQPKEHLQDIASWIKDDAVGFVAMGLNWPSLQRYAYLGDSFTGAIEGLLDGVGEYQDSGDLRIAVTRYRDGDFQIGNLRIGSVMDYLAAQFSSGWWGYTPSFARK